MIALRKLLFEVHAFDRGGVHGGFEDAVAALSLSLRSVHGGVGVGEESIGFGVGLVGERDADTGTDRDLPFRKRQGADECIEDPLRDPASLIGRSRAHRRGWRTRLRRDGRSCRILGG